MERVRLDMMHEDRRGGADGGGRLHRMVLHTTRERGRKTRGGGKDIFFGHPTTTMTTAFVVISGFARGFDPSWGWIGTTAIPSGASARLLHRSTTRTAARCGIVFAFLLLLVFLHLQDGTAGNRRGDGVGHRIMRTLLCGGVGSQHRTGGKGGGAERGWGRKVHAYRTGVTRTSFRVFFFFLLLLLFAAALLLLGGK